MYNFQTWEVPYDEWCKGNVVYRIGEDIYGSGEVGVHNYWAVALISIYEDEIVFTDDSDNEFGLDDIGKTVFLTK